MSHSLIGAALKACESLSEKVRVSKDLARFLEDNNIGRREGRQWILDRRDKLEIRRVLEKEHKIAPHANSGSWKGRARHEALAFGGDEKMTGKSVRAEVIAIKPMPGRQLHLEEGSSILPDGAAMILPWASLKLAKGRYDRVVMVENWEAFERIHRLGFPIPSEFGRSVVIYRGEQVGFKVEATYDWLKAQDLPVYVFSDQDMAGLEIAITTPGYTGLLFPPIEMVRDMLLQDRGLRDRYLKQNHKSGAFLSRCKDPEVCKYRDLFNEFGEVLPQEWLVR